MSDPIDALETRKTVIVGPVRHMFSEDRGDGGCVCCPGGRHRFGIDVPVPAGAYSQYEHLNDVACGFSDFCAQHGMEGKSVRVTFEVTEPRAGDRPPAPSDGSPEYREAIIVATQEALADTSREWEYEYVAGRLIGALLRRGLRIYPVAQTDLLRENASLKETLRNFEIGWQERYDRDPEVNKELARLRGAVRPTPPGAITVERLAALLAEWDGRDPVDARYEQQVATFQSMAAWLLSRLGAASPAAPREEEK